MFKLVSSSSAGDGEGREWTVRAPGRVNVVGEHVDYCGFGVLPFALEQDVRVTVSRRSDGMVVAENADPDRFPAATWPASDASFDIRKEALHWSHYVRCGFLSVSELASSKGATPSRWSGLNLKFHGTVPLGAGLSSSSALVVASALACVCGNGLVGCATPEELATSCAAGERHVGTLGGGMDQAISVSAVAGSAMRIEFVPRLTLSPVPLPAGARFVVANSRVVSSKAATAEGRFNLRVVECRIAAAVLASSLVPSRPWHTFSKLRDVSDAAGLDNDLRAMAREAESRLHAGPYTVAEVASVLGSTEQEVMQKLVIRPVNTGAGFELRKRALHVFTEAQRVREFAESCCATPEPSVGSLGALMNASHRSCRDLYDCSCSELDEIVSICLENGASGARLTGAGWGGCAIALVDGDSAASRLVDALKGQFFEKRGFHNCIEEGDLFTTKPSRGASIATFS